jgi:D-ribulokinase
MRAFIGVDVGTASARAGVFDERGRLLATARHPIAIWREPGDIVEQSSEDIWSACVSAVRSCMRDAALTADAVSGIGFDATCSLAVLDDDAEPLSVSPSGDQARNVIVWMDHRAAAEARTINATKDEVLAYVGGAISPEMQTPKLLWLKRHLPATYAAAGHFLDLADFLSFRATGSAARSMCTLTCKWTYLAHERRWSAAYFERIGLGDLVHGGYRKIGSVIIEPGAAIAQGLSAAAAAEFGVGAGTPVAASLIDAHAGGIGTIGARTGPGTSGDIAGRLAYIMGTSACIMASTQGPCFVPGVWGPYFSGMVPGQWLCEGGQSAAGAAIDHLMRSHPAYPEAAAAAQSQGCGLLDYLEQRVVTNGAGPGLAALLARDVHVLPEFLGNRSPHADPEMRAVIAGLGLHDDVDSLARLFVAGLCGVAYGLADVIDAMRAHGIPCEMLVISGGASRSPLVRQIMTDATGLSVALPRIAEPVLLGAAMLGAVASDAYPSILHAMEAMSEIGTITEPTSAAMLQFHQAKRRVHALMRRLDVQSRAVMAEPVPVCAEIVS